MIVEEVHNLMSPDKAIEAALNAVVGNVADLTSISEASGQCVVKVGHDQIKPVGKGFGWLVPMVGPGPGRG
jgi:hypothetical protein